LFSNVLCITANAAKYQYSTKIGYCKCRKHLLPNGIFDLSITKKICRMNQQLSITKAYKTTIGNTTENDIIILNEALVKPCKHRTVTGFCVRSNRQCPTTMFNLSINK